MESPFHMLLGSWNIMYFFLAIKLEYHVLKKKQEEILKFAGENKMDIEDFNLKTTQANP